MSYSSIIRKPCKCGCGKMPTTGFAGYNENCRPDLKQGKMNKLQERQSAVFAGTKIEKELEESRQNLIEDLDYVTSRITRLSASDEKGNCPCFTCPTVKHFSLMQSGHYIPRANLATRYIEHNQKPQCESCNCHKHGNLKVYKERLEALQPGLSEWLEEQSRLVAKPSKYELKELLSVLRVQLRVLENKIKK